MEPGRLTGDNFFFSNLYECLWVKAPDEFWQILAIVFQVIPAYVPQMPAGN